MLISASVPFNAVVCVVLLYRSERCLRESRARNLHPASTIYRWERIQRLVNAARGAGSGAVPVYTLLQLQSNIDILQGKHLKIPASLYQLTARNPSLEKDRTAKWNGGGERRDEGEGEGQRGNEHQPCSRGFRVHWQSINYDD